MLIEKCLGDHIATGTDSSLEIPFGLHAPSLIRMCYVSNFAKNELKHSHQNLTYEELQFHCTTLYTDGRLLAPLSHKTLSTWDISHQFLTKLGGQSKKKLPMVRKHLAEEVKVQGLLSTVEMICLASLHVLLPSTPHTGQKFEM
jgi:hypothetical protein